MHNTLAAFLLMMVPTASTGSHHEKRYYPPVLSCPLFTASVKHAQFTLWMVWYSVVCCCMSMRTWQGEWDTGGGRKRMLRRETGGRGLPYLNGSCSCSPHCNQGHDSQEPCCFVQAYKRSVSSAWFLFFFSKRHLLLQTLRPYIHHLFFAFVSFLSKGYPAIYYLNFVYILDGSQHLSILWKAPVWWCELGLLHGYYVREGLLI